MGGGGGGGGRNSRRSKKAPKSFLMTRRRLRVTRRTPARPNPRSTQRFADGEAMARKREGGRERDADGRREAWITQYWAGFASTT